MLIRQNYPVIIAFSFHVVLKFPVSLVDPPVLLLFLYVKILRIYPLKSGAATVLFPPGD